MTISYCQTMDSSDLMPDYANALDFYTIAAYNEDYVEPVPEEQYKKKPIETWVIVLSACFGLFVLLGSIAIIYLRCCR